MSSSPATVADFLRIAPELKSLTPTLWAPGAVSVNQQATTIDGNIWVVTAAGSGTSSSSPSGQASPFTEPGGGPTWTLAGPSAVQGFLQDAADQLNQPRWLNLYSQGQAWLAAHLAALANPALVAGESDKLGDASTTYRKAAGDHEGYEQTRWGVQFLAFQRTLGRSVAVL